MEQYFRLVGLTRSRPFLTCFCLDDSQVEIKDVLGKDDNVTFIVGLQKESATTLRVRYLFIFLTSSRQSLLNDEAVHSRGHAHISRSSPVLSYYSLKLVEASQLQ